jgi:hypothetical protein
MVRMKRDLMIVSTLALVMLITSACNQAYSQAPAATFTPVPQNLFASAVPQARPRALPRKEQSRPPRRWLWRIPPPRPRWQWRKLRNKRDRQPQPSRLVHAQNID